MSRKASKTNVKSDSSNNNVLEHPFLQEMELKVKVPIRLFDDVQHLLDERGSTISELVRILLRQYMKNFKVYGLNDSIDFGKLSGEKMESIIRTQPDYIVWMLKNKESFKLTGQARDLLNEMVALSTVEEPGTL